MVSSTRAGFLILIGGKRARILARNDKKNFRAMMKEHLQDEFSSFSLAMGYVDAGSLAPEPRRFRITDTGQQRASSERNRAKHRICAQIVPPGPGSKRGLLLSAELLILSWAGRGRG